MDRIDFDKIVSGQKEITDDKMIVKSYKKITMRCGFLNLRGYDSAECDITPYVKYGEIRLIEPDDCYTDYTTTLHTYSRSQTLKQNPSNDKRWNHTRRQILPNQ